MKMLGFILCGLCALAAAQSPQAPVTKSQTAKRFENPYLSITTVPGWTVSPSTDRQVSLTHGKYVLSIDPIYLHASGVTCGRFAELTGEIPSVAAVMANVDQPAGGDECSQSPAAPMVVNQEVSLGNLYTDRSKSNNGCVFPSHRQPVWFGSSFCGAGSESEYSITLGYEVHDVNQLPIKNSAGLKKVFADVVEMLKTLKLNPPIVISKISPESAQAGQTVTVYGNGFRIPGFTTAVVLGDFPNNPMPAPVIEAAGKSLTFKIPDSINTVSCESGQARIGESCLPTPPDHVNGNECPQKSNGSSNFCGIPLAPGTYRVAVWAESSGVSSNPMSLIVLPKPTPVEITVLYPNSSVDPGDTITVHGGGFTPTGNAIQIGSSIVENIPSSDGKTIRFRAPTPSGESFYYGDQVYKASVSNSNGESNAIAIGYR